MNIKIGLFWGVASFLVAVAGATGCVITGDGDDGDGDGNGGAREDANNGNGGATGGDGGASSGGASEGGAGGASPAGEAGDPCLTDDECKVGLACYDDDEVAALCNEGSVTCSCG